MDPAEHLPRFPRDERGPVVLCVGLLLLITGLRLAVDNPIEAVGFLYVIPISLLATDLGLRGGLIAAGGALLLTIVWAIVQDVPLGVIGYGARAVTFVGIGIVVGLQSQRRIRIQERSDRLIVKLEATALRDPLTGLPNRRAWDDRLKRELSGAARSQQPLRVVVVDLDRLKQINDLHGHQQGDRLLQRAAHAWAGVLRPSDCLARLGGDEFVVLLPDCDAATASDITQRLLASVPFGQTCSAGIATWDGDEPAFQLVHRADQAMYAIKVAGGGDLGVAPAPEGMSLMDGVCD